MALQGRLLRPRHRELPAASDRVRVPQIDLGPMKAEDGTTPRNRGPARRVGLSFEAGLVDSILADAGDSRATCRWWSSCCASYRSRAREAWCTGGLPRHRQARRRHRAEGRRLVCRAWRSRATAAAGRMSRVWSIRARASTTRAGAPTPPIRAGLGGLVERLTTAAAVVTSLSGGIEIVEVATKH